VRVVRGGAEVTLSCFDLLVGDVVLVEAGDILPADGLLYAGGALKCVPSSSSSSSSSTCTSGKGVACACVHAAVLMHACLHGHRILHGYCILQIQYRNSSIEYGMQFQQWQQMLAAVLMAATNLPGICCMDAAMRLPLNCLMLCLLHRCCYCCCSGSMSPI
jgi:hypothetical protein